MIAMVEERDLIRSLMDACCVPAFICDEAGDVLARNRELRRLLTATSPDALIPAELTEALSSGRCGDGAWPGRDGSPVQCWRTRIYPGMREDGHLVLVQGEWAADDPAEPGSGDSALFRAIFDHSHLLVAYLDRDLRFVRVNHTYAAADEREPEFFVGKRHFDLYPHVQNERVFRRVLETGEPHFEVAKPFSYPGNPERGVSYWDWTLVPLHSGFEGGEVQGLILTLIDVTERVRSIEQLQEVAKRREALLREVHHRVKNNLQVVASLLGLQRARVTDAAAANALEDSRRRVQAMGLIHDRLYRSDDFGRVSFGTHCEQLVEDLRRAFRGDDETLRVVLEVDRSIHITPEQTVPAMLILNELVTNALRHAFPGGEGGCLRVAFGRLEGNLVELSVEDDGVGFPPGDSTEDSGETLGLRLVRSLARQLEGEMVLRPGNPTRVAVRFEPGRG